MKQIKRISLVIISFLFLFSSNVFCLSHRDWDGDKNTTYIEVNNNQPTFTKQEIEQGANEFYDIGDRDNLGRETKCMMSAGPGTLPTTEREPSLSSVTPSGWKYNGKSNNNKYPGVVSGNYIYNRCHQLGYQYSGLGSETPENLITGTRWFNVISMLPFENDIKSYIKKKGNHVLVRSTPIYEGNNLVAEGIIFEGYSVEDNGKGICFNVFCPNVQPGIAINYATGQNWLEEEAPAEFKNNINTEDISYSDPFYTEEKLKETNETAKKITAKNSNKTEIDATDEQPKVEEIKEETVKSTKTKGRYQSNRHVEETEETEKKTTTKKKLKISNPFEGLGAKLGTLGAIIFIGGMFLFMRPKDNNDSGNGGYGGMPGGMSGYTGGNNTTGSNFFG